MSDGASALFARDRGAIVTQYDVLKSLAVVLMIADHIGHYFLNDDLVWRAVGRACVPLWFWLAGAYLPQRAWSRPLFLGGLIVELVHANATHSLLPLNSLFTIIAIRAQSMILHDVTSFIPAAPATKRNLKLFAGLLLYVMLLCVAVPATTPFFEYGSIALMFGMCSYLQNQPTSLTRFAKSVFIAAAVTFCICQQINQFGFSGVTAFLCAAGMAMTSLLLWRALLRSALPTPLIVAPLLRLGGRYTLEIYVVHLVGFIVLRQYYI